MKKMRKNKENGMKKRKEYKTILILCVIIAAVLSASLAAILLSRRNTAKNKYANIYQDGNLIHTIDLTAVKQPYTFTIEGKNGAENVIEVRKGEIGISSASCPDHVCVKMGFISTGAIPVTCLPNHIVIEIGNTADNDMPDGVAY